MTTIRIQVRDELIQRLNAVLSTGVPEATKRRWVPGMRITEPAIAVFFNSENASQPGGNRAAVTNRQLAVVVQCRITCKTPEEIDDALEVLLAHVSNTLDVPLISKPTVIMSITETQTKWETAESDRIYAIASSIFTVEFQTKRGDVDLRS